MPTHEGEEAVQLLPISNNAARDYAESDSSTSTTSLVFEHIDQRVREEENQKNENGKGKNYAIAGRGDTMAYTDDVDAHTPLTSGDDIKESLDLEEGPYVNAGVNKAKDKSFKRLMWIIGGVFIGAWVLAFVLYLGRQSYRHSSAEPHDPEKTTFRGNGKQVTMDQIFAGEWRATKHQVSWIEGSNGEDGLLLEQNAEGKDYLVVEDVRGKNTEEANVLKSTTLMKEGTFKVGDKTLSPSKVWPSKDLQKVLIATDVVQNWRHSFYANYWIFDVATQKAQPLDPAKTNGRVQLATWSPQSDAIAFTRDNNIFLRKLSSDKVIQITTDGGPDYFYGVPDWVYEEEVFSGNSATWFSDNGKYIAFLRTNESAVPEYPVQYFLSRPSGKKPLPGEENYPEVRNIKYPKAGAPNPVVGLEFYDVVKDDVFEIRTSGQLPDHDRLITEVIWAGHTGQVIVREINRESDLQSIVLIDVLGRRGRTVRTVNIADIDGGWFEVSQKARFIPADPQNGRPHDGYIDTVIHSNYDHLGYFSPLEMTEPLLLTSGKWEVVSAPSAVDLKNNLVYFVGTKESPIQRHIYSVKLDGSDLKPMTDISKEGYYDSSFSSGANFALLSYDGPGIPWQKVISTPGNPNHYENVIEENKGLAEKASKHELPVNLYSTVTIDGYELQVVERRPRHFNPKKKYPVLFHLYGGPGSQTVSKQFSVDFQAYIASALGYIVVTVDGRGTGFIGRKARCIVRGNLGYWEARDQIETAKIWAGKSYVDSSRIAIWGWSYGGFMTLKTLEQDAGETFSYGMAVAPVTDWRFYDSIYTERYMHTPQNNPGGYDNSSISNMTALSQNVRFLLMHGVADDNVHMQNSLTLLDKLDLAGVENYDVHVFPDSDHSIFFHNANRIVYDKLNNWLINAFNGEWLKITGAAPIDVDPAPKFR